MLSVAVLLLISEIALPRKMVPGILLARFEVKCWLHRAVRQRKISYLNSGSFPKEVQKSTEKSTNYVHKQTVLSNILKSCSSFDKVFKLDVTGQLI